MASTKAWEDIGIAFSAARSRCLYPPRFDGKESPSGAKSSWKNDCINFSTSPELHFVFSSNHIKSIVHCTHRRKLLKQQLPNVAAWSACQISGLLVRHECETCAKYAIAAQLGRRSEAGHWGMNVSSPHVRNAGFFREPNWIGFARSSTMTTLREARS